MSGHVYNSVNADHNSCVIAGDININNYNVVPADASSHTIFQVNRLVNRNFTGRAQILRTIKQALLEDQTHTCSRQQRRFVISGSPGLGKSELCLKIAHDLQSRFWGVFWIDVSSNEAAEIDLQRIMALLCRPYFDVTSALQVISNLQDNWLLVIDNADNLGIDYQHYLPKGSRGAVLITSRNPETEIYQTVGYVDLNGLDEDDACTLLLKASQRKNDGTSFMTSVRTVARMLFCHPLALTQAGAYIRKSSCSFTRYAEIFEGQRQRLLRTAPKEMQARFLHIYGTFESSVHQIEFQDTPIAKAALEILSIVPFLGKSPIPSGIITYALQTARSKCGSAPTGATEAGEFGRLSYWHFQQLPSNLLSNYSSTTSDTFELFEVLDLLSSLALIDLYETGDSHLGFKMHPLMHAWARDRLDANQQKAAFLAAGALLSFACPVLEYNRFPAAGPVLGWLASKKATLISSVYTERQPGEEIARPNLDHISEGVRQIVSEIPEMEVTWMVFRMICVLTEWNDYDLAHKLLLLVFEMYNHDPLTPCRGWLQPHRLHARLLQESGDPRAALELLQSLVDLTNTEEPNNVITILRYNLLRAYLHCNEPLASIVLAECYIRELESLGRCNALLHCYQLALAQGCRLVGNHEEVIALLEPLIRHPPAALEADSGLLLDLQQELSLAYAGSNRLAEAIAGLEYVTDARSQQITIAPFSHSLLESRHFLALLYLDAGRLDSALDVIQDVVGWCKRTRRNDDSFRRKCEILLEECKSRVRGSL